MYNDFYSFSKKPFHITPNPDFLFLSENHKEVFAHLLYGIENHTGFIEVTGEVGTGKTTVLRTLLNQLDNEDYRLAFVFNPALSALELLQTINREFGIPADSSSRSELQQALNHFLLQENRIGRTVVLVIDEAQNLQAEVLEEIRLLSNLETETDKLIQIVLVGQPELAATLSRPELRQLSQRITVRYHLKSMSAADTAAYISHRLKVAGYSGSDLFDAAAVRRIYRASQGYPRLINVLCDRALLVGYAHESRRIDKSMVRTAIRELDREEQLSRRRWQPVAGLLVMALILGVGGYVYLERGFQSAASSVPQPEPESAVAAEATAPPGPVLHGTEPVVTWENLSSARRQLAAMEPTATLEKAAVAVFDRWAIPAFELPDMAAAEDFIAAGRSFDLDTLSYGGPLAGLLDINLPALIELNLPGEGAPRYLALTGMKNGRAHIAPPLLDRDAVSAELLEGLWTGRALIPWKNHAGIGFIARPGSTLPDVGGLQQLLHEAGYSSAPSNGVYDRATLASVTRFQADRGLAQDGRVGPLTLIHLYQAAGLFRQPGLLPTRVGGQP